MLVSITATSSPSFGLRSSGDLKLVGVCALGDGFDAAVAELPESPAGVEAAEVPEPDCGVSEDCEQPLKTRENANVVEKAALQRPRAVT